MTALAKIRQWLQKFPGHEYVGDLKVDFSENDLNEGSIAPSGLVEISRKEDVMGNVTVENQYNFSLYYSFPKATSDDEGATMNAEWLLQLQEWVQEQSVLRQTPVFGDDAASEWIKAQNGAIYGVTEEGIALYTVQLSVYFIKKIEVN